MVSHVSFLVRPWEKETLMNNKVVGTKFEREFAEMLAKHRFWVHLFQDNKNGQPCDIVAAYGGHTYLIDCKNCEKDYFLLSRMEENQYNAMELFKRMGNEDGWFAIQFSGGDIYMLPYWKIIMMQEHGVKRLSKQECKLYGMVFIQWLYDFDCGRMSLSCQMNDRRIFKNWLGKCMDGKLCRLP